MTTDAGISYQVELRELPEQHTAVAHVQIATPDLPETVGRIWSAVGAHVEAAGIAPTGPYFLRYASFDYERADFEGGLPVPAPIAGAGEVRPSTLPGGPVVATTHTGPFELFGGAYRAIADWLAAEGWEADGPPWEVYWIGPTTEPDPGKWRTELVQPVRRPAGSRA
jgi:effector-binding domain-containing protein